jgi:hypothetical protein
MWWQKKGEGVQRRCPKKVVKIPRNMAKGEAENDIGRDSRRDFESCKKYRSRVKHSDRRDAANGMLDSRGWSDGHEN